MVTKPDETESDQRSLLMQALGNQYSRLQSARGGTISESSSRSGIYLTSLTGAVVSLSFVAQATHFGESFFVFALAILPVVFFLGLVSYYRILQTGIEDVIYARAISKIQQFYSEIDPSHADLFHASAVDQVGLRDLGLFRLWWQQFLSGAAVIAIVNSVVGGVFIGLSASYLLQAPTWVASSISVVAAAVLILAFLRHQWRNWMRVAKALPVSTGAAPKPT